MVIFHSYVKLPEGNPHVLYMACLMRKLMRKPSKFGAYDFGQAPGSCPEGPVFWDFQKRRSLNPKTLSHPKPLKPRLWKLWILNWKTLRIRIFDSTTFSMLMSGQHTASVGMISPPFLDKPHQHFICLEKTIFLERNIQWEISRILKWRYISTVPYFWPYELWGYPLKFRPEK